MEKRPDKNQYIGNLYGFLRDSNRYMDSLESSLAEKDKEIERWKDLAEKGCSNESGRCPYYRMGE